jgi:sugar phosphate isomerase/epimerase
MQHKIACRPACYDLPLAAAVAELKSVGIEHVEVRPPADGEYKKLARTVADAGLTITSIGTGVQLTDAAQVTALEAVIAGAAQIGTRVIFVSVGVRGVQPEEGLPTLAALAETARKAGVVLSMETHEPYGYNGDVAVRTLKAVGSAGLGFNFDTANIYYYNPQGVDAVAELRKVLPYVTSVHLKESAKGEPKSFDFPVLGEGIVDFPAVFKLLDEREFAGPYTLELEGPVVDGLPVAERTAKVRACVEYLERIGV